LLLVLNLQLIHDPLDCIFDEEQREEAVLTPDYLEQIVFDSQQNFGDEVADLAADELIELHLLLLVKHC